MCYTVTKLKDLDCTTSRFAISVCNGKELQRIAELVMISCARLGLRVFGIEGAVDEAHRKLCNHGSPAALDTSKSITI